MVSVLVFRCGEDNKRDRERRELCICVPINPFESEPALGTEPSSPDLTYCVSGCQRKTEQALLRKGAVQVSFLFKKKSLLQSPQAIEK